MAKPNFKGGIIKERVVPPQKSPIEISWGWEDQQEGLITWIFKNTGEKTESFALLRSGYYFGNAFYPVYEANPEFDTEFMTVNNQLTEGDSTPPLAVVYFSGKPIVCFVFTLGAGQTWTMVEGGWSPEFEPTAYSAVPVSEVTVKEFSIKYNPEQVTQWDEQSGTDYQGWYPNPSTFKVMKFVSTGEYISLFNKESITPVTASSGTSCWETYIKELEDIFSKFHL